MVVEEEEVVVEEEEVVVEEDEVVVELELEEEQVGVKLLVEEEEVVEEAAAEENLAKGGIHFADGGEDEQVISAGNKGSLEDWFGSWEDDDDDDVSGGFLNVGVIELKEEGRMLFGDRLFFTILSLSVPPPPLPPCS